MATIAVAEEPEIQTHIVLQPGRSVSGVVRFDLSPTGAARPGGTVTLANAPGAQANAVSSPPQAQVGPDGRFTLRGVIPGRYVFRTNLGSLKEATVDGRDALDFPLEFTGERDIADVVLTVTDQTTVLSGVLTDSHEQPAVDYSIVVATADPRYWTPGSRRVMLTRPDTSGRYGFRNLPPGDYLLAVVDDIEAGAHFDPEFLRGLTGSAVRITLTEGATVTSNLRVGR